MVLMVEVGVGVMVGCRGGGFLWYSRFGDRGMVGWEIS